jgi:hypothetical protein
MKCNFPKQTILSLSLLCVTTSCGWHLADSLSPHKKQTISIPYISGDSDGSLTSCVVEQIEQQGGLKYVPDGGAYTLSVELLDSKSQHIGFRQDPKKLTKGKHKLIPSETRRKLLAKVEVIDALSQKIIIGPAYIVGSCDFDHQNYSLKNDINNFSLGQLTDIDTAYDVVDIPLHRDLARNIAQYLANANFESSP